MKYIILLGDGMADEQLAELGGKTPLQYASTPHMDFVASYGEIGMAGTVPAGFPPGSDVANLSVLGYDPRLYYSGRSPLEAVSMGINLDSDDVAFRCNLVTLSEEDSYEDKTMVDYSADEITTAESGKLIEEVTARLGNTDLKFCPGFGFRHLLVWKGGLTGGELTPPHDISGRVIGPYLPKGPGGEILMNLMRESSAFLPAHPVNAARTEKGLRPANAIWFWGMGKKPQMPKFYDRYRLKGSIISAVDLIKGIGICAGFNVVELEGVTGTVSTNAEGKVQAALDELSKGQDLVYVHVEAPDAASHRGELDTKLKAIEMVDQMLGRLLHELDTYDNYKLMVLPDHPTPLATMTHSSNPVPFAIYKKGQTKKT
ncbi:MAG: cofactor-independent phosphoglycerate mutase, partial [Desulfotomaculaceae bacterium]|nr:cofactor-independent phosphoglycerate mutase [Desulfotomaculaceae bacterium]